MDQISNILGQQAPQIGIYATLVNFILCIIMGFVIRSFYIRWSHALTAKNHLGAVLPVLAAVVFLVITVVKSSLALSLGLVGALSIVRFRTPIKEPEELLYLFLAISIGLGYGAGQTEITTLLIILTLLFSWFFLSRRSNNQALEYSMLLAWRDPGVGMEAILSEIRPIAEGIRLVRFETGDEGSSAVLQLTPLNFSDLDGLQSRLREHCSALSVSFYETQNA